MLHRNLARCQRTWLVACRGASLRQGAVRRGRARCGDGALSHPGPPLPRQLLDAARRGARQRRHVRGQASLRSLHRHGVGRGEHLFPPRVRGTRRHGEQAHGRSRYAADRRLKAIMHEAAETRSYAAALSVLVVAEWLYLDWASRAPQPLPVNFVHAEWITLHDNPGFRGFVDFLRAELDRLGPAQEDLCRAFFQRAVALEPSFFEAAYPDRT